MDTTFIRNVTELGNTLVLAYLLIVLMPRAGGRIEALSRWLVEIILAEMRSLRAEHAAAFTAQAEWKCRYPSNADPAAIAGGSGNKQS